MLKTRYFAGLAVVLMGTLFVTLSYGQQHDKRPPGLVATADAALTQPGKCRRVMDRIGQYVCASQESYRACVTYLKSQKMEVKYCSWSNHANTEARTDLPTRVQAQLRTEACQLRTGTKLQTWVCQTDTGMALCYSFVRGGAVGACLRASAPKEPDHTTSVAPGATLGPRPWLPVSRYGGYSSWFGEL